MKHLTLLVILGLSACAAAPGASPPPSPSASIADAPTFPLPPPAAPDACGARDLQWLVGQPRSRIPVPTDPSKRRVACTTCPVTMDYRSDRLNIFYDAQTGIITEVKCG